MAGVFDIDLDQPEENVSDDENEEVLGAGEGRAVGAKQRYKLFLPRAAAAAAAAVDRKSVV